MAARKKKTREKTGKGKSPRLRRQEVSKIGEYVYRQIERQGVTAAAFAESVGQSPQNLSAMLRTADPRLSTVTRIAGFFDQTTSKFLAVVERWHKDKNRKR